MKSWFDSLRAPPWSEPRGILLHADIPIHVYHQRVANDLHRVHLQLLQVEDLVAILRPGHHHVAILAGVDELVGGEEPAAARAAPKTPNGAIAPKAPAKVSIERRENPRRFVSGRLLVELLLVSCVSIVSLPKNHVRID